MRQMGASAGQRLLWFLGRYRNYGGALNCPMVCRISGPLNLKRLSAALDNLHARHESLRTTFSGGGRTLMQVIHPSHGLPLRQVDLAGGLRLQDVLACELRSSLEPTEEPVRATLWRIDPLEHVLCLNMHHIVTDTWSCDVLLRELADAYAGQVLPPVGWQYRQFVLWQERQLARAEFRAHEEYWSAHLAGVRPLELPITLDGTATERRLSEYTDIPAAVSDRLRGLALSRRTTMFAVMLAVYYALVHRITGQDDVAVASLFANRTRPELERTVGFLANLLVLRTQAPHNASFIDVIDVTRRVVADAFAHQQLPFHLVPMSNARQGTLRLDDVVFQMLAEPLDASIPAGDVAFQGMVPDVVGRFDFELALMPRAGGFAAKLYYTQGRIDARWAREFIDSYAAIAGAAATAPDLPLQRLQI